MTDAIAATTSNTTAIEGWNVTTLKAYFDTRLDGFKTETTLKFEGRDKALVLQFQLDQEHFKSLNNEASRLLKQQEASVSRDMWDTYLTAYHTWQADTNAKVAQGLTRSEFNAYKEATDKALNVGTGKWQGVLQLVTTIASVAAIVSVAFVLLRSP